MLDMAFQYDCIKKEWVRCGSRVYVRGEIEKLPHALVVQYELQNKNHEIFISPQQYVFCRKHRRTEKITEIRRNYVVSADGCAFEGLIAGCVLHLAGWGYPPTEYVPFRWRIFQNHPGAPINIAGDVAEVHYDRAAVLMHWLNCGISIHPAKPVFLTTKIRDLVEEDWTKGTNVEIPDIVLDAAMEALRESTRVVFGIKPSMLSQMKGRAKLLAYAERPFDINIVFLKHFLRDYIGKNFDGVFPYECKDNYRKVCQLLDINPPKSLRKAYSFNPYAIVWYMLFQQWGVKDINLMQKFFYLDRRVADNPLDMLYINKKTRQIERTGRNYWHNDETDWQGMNRLCAWMLSQNGEKKFLRWLYQISTGEELERWQWDIVRSFYQYENALSEDLKRILAHDGLTQYVHDQISWEVTAYSNGLKDVHVPYEPHVLAYECVINGYEFRLVHDTRILRHAGLTLQNCVATYREAVINHRSIIVVVWHEGHYVACIELQRETDIVQALGVKNQRLIGEVLLVCRFWAKQNKLNFATDHLDLRGESQRDMELSDVEEITIEPMQYHKTMDEMNAAELLALPEADICPDYFKFLGLRLLKEFKHNLSAPPWIQFQDEQAYLTYVFPQGQRIYDAAFNGNTVAQRVLGMMYCSGRAFHRDTEKALEWFSKAAESGDECARWEMEKLKKYIGGDMTEKDFKLLWGLYRIRQMGQEEGYPA